MQSPSHTGSSTARDRCARLTQGARCNQVIEAAIELFARKGFQGTKTKEIAEAAGINEALIFRDFRNKEKLYCAILEYVSSRINAARWIEELTPCAERHDDEVLFSNLAAKLLDGFGREPNLYRLMLYSALEDHELARKFRQRHFEPMERFIENYIRARQAQGEFRNDDPHVLGRSFLNMCHHHILRKVLFCDGSVPSDAATAKTLTQVFLHGVRSH